MTAPVTATLSEFLLARIAEDEAEAEGLQTLAYGLVDALKGPQWLGRPIPGWAYWPDVAAMTTRALAECEAKRRLVELVQMTGLHGIARVLALPYADHPDYRKEWRP